MPTEPHEDTRLQALHALDILDTAPESEYDELAQLAAAICGVPVGLISMIDRERQWFKAKVGVEETEIPRELSFCNHILYRPELMVVEDTRLDARFQDNILVTAPPAFRFYAGIPLCSADQPVGTLCVLDTEPRTLTDSQRTALQVLARQTQARLEERAKRKELQRALAENERLNAALAARSNLLQAFMNTGPFVSYIKDAKGRMQFYNTRMLESFGIRGNDWIGKTDHEIWPKAMADQFRANDLAVMAGGKPVVVDEQTPGRVGDAVHWRSYKFPIEDEGGAPMLAGISIDLTEEIERTKSLEAALEAARQLSKSLDRSHTLFRTFLDNNPTHCYLKSADGRYEFYNRKFATHFGIDQRKWIGLTDFDILPKALAEQSRKHDLLVLEGDQMVETIGELADTDGVVSNFKLLKFPCKDDDGARMLAGVAINITGELKQQRKLAAANAKLTEIASSDALTGLSNRRTLDARLPEAFHAAVRGNRPLSVLVVDVDNFKRINDSFGHAAGDLVLRAVGKVLHQCCRPGDLVARSGGEEFAYLLPGTGPEEAATMAERVLKAVRGLKADPCAVTVSIGVATTNPTTVNAERLMSRADDAMYAAKRSGKDRVIVHQAYLEALMHEASRQMRTAEAGPVV